MGEPPSQVHVTVLKEPSGLTAERVVRALRRLPASTSLIVLALVALLAAGSVALTRLTGTPQQGRIGAASGFPVRCVSLSIALHDPRFLRTDFERALSCSAHAGRALARSYTTAGRVRSQ